LALKAAKASGLVREACLFLAPTASSWNDMDATHLLNSLAGLVGFRGTGATAGLSRTCPGCPAPATQELKNFPPPSFATVAFEQGASQTGRIFLPQQP